MIRLLAPTDGQLPALVLMRECGLSGVVDGILDTLHGPSLVSLIRLVEFRGALLVNLRNLRKPPGYPPAVRRCP